MLLRLKKIQLILLIAFAFTIPFGINHFQVSNFIMIVLALNGVALYILGGRQKIRTPGIAIFLLAFYIIQLIGLVGSDNMSQGFSDLEKKLGIVLLPLVVFSFPGGLGVRQTERVLMVFILSCVLTSWYCVIRAFIQYSIDHNPSILVYHDLSEFANMRANYLAMQICFAIAILMYLNYRHAKEQLVKYQSVFFYFALSSLVIMIFLLSSRIHIILLTIGVVGFSFALFYKRFQLLKAIMGAIIVGIAVLAVIFMFPRNRERFLEGINYNENQWGEQQIRGSIWTCASQLITDRPLAGVGTGDGRDALERCYREHDFSALFYWPGIRFNAHNQFLETTVEQGIIGLFILLGIFATCAYYGIKQRKIGLLLFPLIFGFSCLTESVLERQKGIVFFAFFIPLLAVSSLDNNASQHKTNSSIKNAP